MIKEKKEDWQYADKEEEILGIQTLQYENGSLVKRCTLSDGKVAKCRQLKGKDRHMINRISAGERDKVQDAVIALSTQIDGKDIIIETLDDLKFVDYTKVSSMATTLNFT